MERILKVLKSGKEGRYFELEACAEAKLRELKPESPLLKQTLPVHTIRALPKVSRITARRLYRHRASVAWRSVACCVWRVAWRGAARRVAWYKRGVVQCCF